MEMQGVSTTLDELTAETGWLRRLARSLVHDVAAAEDLVHDAYVVAAERLPDDGRPLRPWLVHVMTNLTRMRHREAHRRGVRERAVAGLIGDPATPAELAERLELHRMLTELVLGLGQGARDVVLLHYFEGLSSAEIGARLGLAAGTVRWRLSQALAELRGKLDERQPKRAWMAALSGLAGVPRRAVGLQLLVAAAIALIVVAGWIVVQLHGATEDAQPTSAAWQARRTAAQARRDALAGVIEPAQPGPSLGPPLPPSQRRVDGRVVDDRERGVADAEVSLRCGMGNTGEVAHARTSATGAFTFVVDATCHARMIAHKDASSASGYDMGPVSPNVLPLQPDVIATVHVLDDATGAPLVGARVSASLLGEQPLHAPVTSDAAGEARIPLFATTHEVPEELAPDFKLIARADGYAIGTAQLPRAYRQPFERTIRLLRGVEITGEVVDTEGNPAAGVDITVFDAAADPSSFPIHSAADELSDASGHFVIRVARPGAYQLWPGNAAMAPIAPEKNVFDVGPGGRTGAVLHVRRRGETGVDGLVLDASGRPVAGARVTSPNPTVAAMTSDAQGRFRIRGAIQGFPLVAWAGDQASEYVPVEPQRGRVVPVTLTLGLARITGVVVDPQGQPVASAQVWVNFDDVSPFSWAGIAKRYFTDDHGGFALDVPRGVFRISVRRSFDDDFLDQDDVVLRGGTRDARIVLP